MSFRKWYNIYTILDSVLSIKNFWETHINISFMKNLKTIIVVIFAFLLCFGCANNTNKKKQPTPKQPKIIWTMKTYAVNGGWGYFIYCNEKQLNWS